MVDAGTAARSSTFASPLQSFGSIVGEIVRMLGADREDAAARRHARELLKAA